jgi:hypothetical protein
MMLFSIIKPENVKSSIVNLLKETVLANLQGRKGLEEMFKMKKDSWPLGNSNVGTLIQPEFDLWQTA